MDKPRGTGHPMRALVRFFLAATISLSASACTIRHNIAQDYPQYLVNNTGRANLSKTGRASEYLLTPATQQHHYEFPVLTFYGNLWIVEFGKMLDDTLMSTDVQQAFGSLRKASGQSAASDGLLIFDLEQYTFEDFGAHISLKISLSHTGKVVFSKTYVQDGKTQGGKIWWGGVFAVKNAVQQSTKLALDEILRQLIADLSTKMQ
jgi:hypothetical protein